MADRLGTDVVERRDQGVELLLWGQIREIAICFERRHNACVVFFKYFKGFRIFLKKEMVIKYLSRIGQDVLIVRKAF